MEARIRDRFHDGILAAACAAYGIPPAAAKPWGGFESFIFRFERDEQAYFLRIGHSLRRSEALIQAELDFIDHLALHEAPVVQPVRSRQARWVEAIPDEQDGAFLATAFLEAPGTHSRPDDWTDAFLERYGRAIGQMHAAAQVFEPSHPDWRRPHWDDERLLDVAGWLPAEDAPVAARYTGLLDQLRRLPQTDQVYGLIHQDAHAGNFFLTPSGEFTFFDFDDCGYSWYVNDLAIVLFYAVFDFSRNDPTGFTRRFLRHFVQGYRAETTLENALLAQIPHFLTLREIQLYTVIQRSFDVTNLTHPWVKRFMQNRRERIVARTPYLPFDFSNL